MKSNEYLTFTKRERNGIISLILILILVIILSRYCRREPNITDAMVSFKTDTSHDQINTPREKPVQEKYMTASREFYKQERPPPRVFVKKSLKSIEINTADTTALIDLPGIGSKLAARIILFREKLGGFYKVDQVGEVYGLQDSIFQKLRPYLKCDNTQIKKIHINNATKEELKIHPYIRWKLADVIVDYRNEHGSFSNIKDLEKIEVIDEETLKRLEAYIDFR